VIPLSEPNIFLTFPNPQKQADGSIQTTSREYAEAYYRDIDPLNERDTAVKYRAKNGFDSGTGEQVTVIFGDIRDLGTGRRMTVRRNTTARSLLRRELRVKLAADYAFNIANLEAAIVRDTRWLPYSNGHRVQPGPNGGVPSEVLQLRRRHRRAPARGEHRRARPEGHAGMCISCHGGRGDPLTPPDAQGKRHLPIVANGVSQGSWRRAGAPASLRGRMPWLSPTPPDGRARSRKPRSRRSTPGSSARIRRRRPIPIPRMPVVVRRAPANGRARPPR
jgi:hypothetical protein